MLFFLKIYIFIDINKLSLTTGLKQSSVADYTIYDLLIVEGRLIFYNCLHSLHLNLSGYLSHLSCLQSLLVFIIIFSMKHFWWTGFVRGFNVFCCLEHIFYFSDRSCTLWQFTDRDKNKEGLFLFCSIL